VTATAAHDVVEPVVSRSEVSVTAGLTDDAPTVEQPWDGLEQAIPNSLRKANVRATDIPDVVNPRSSQECRNVAA
jgi:hypothetical protein